MGGGKPPLQFRRLYVIGSQPDKLHQFDVAVVIEKIRRVGAKRQVGRKERFRIDPEETLSRRINADMPHLNMGQRLQR